MGTTSSSNGTLPSDSFDASPGRSGDTTFSYGNENDELARQRNSGIFELDGEPRSQGPSPYATLTNEERWRQRPTAPSLSSLTNSKMSRQENVLTYATQMTGWQPADGSPFTHHQQQQNRHHETMELSRIVSQLAMANQQLASAHNATLSHLESIYIEFRKEREGRRRGTSSVDVETFGNPLEEDVLRKRLSDEEEEEDREERNRKRTLELRLDRFERLLENFQSKHGRNSRREEERRLRCRVDRLERLVNIRSDKEDQNFNEERSLERVKVPENEVKSEGSKSSGEASNSGSMHLEKKNRRKVSLEERREKAANQDLVRLTEEIERLKIDKMEYQNANERLLVNLEEQKRVIEKLSKDYEESKMRYEKIECSLIERRQQYDELVNAFDVTKKEMERSLKEIDAFHIEKDTAEAKISSLEQDLQKSLMEKEQIKNIESQKASKLRAQLSEEVSDKKKQIKALEDALDEIQRLKETIKTERKNEEDVARKEDESENSIEIVRDDVQENSSADRSANLEEFKKELTLKRETRQRAIAAVSSEMERLRRELDAEKEAHSETSRVLDLLRSAQANSQAEVSGNVSNTSVTDGSFRKSRIKEQKPDENEIAMKKIDALRLTSILKVSDELRNDVRFQIEKVDDLRYQLETEPEQHRFRIRGLGDFTQKTKETLYIRERRTNELKDHLAQVLVRLGDRSFLDIKDDIGIECDQQLENINTLKGLYNERLRVLTELKDAAVKELVDVKERLDHSSKKSDSLEEDLKRAEEKVDAQDTEISNLESQLGLTKADCRDLQNQMSLINGLFSQMLLGATSADMDLDRLTQLLQENHDLISDMAREEGTEAAALPKLLLDLVEQVEGSKGSQKRNDGEENAEGDTEKKEEDLQQGDIAHNLPKVWRVLLELLSCHAAGTPTASVTSSSDPNSCYKSVDTPAGPRLVISVSKTYIRLKELILEKKHLEKEMNRMKQLNSHLESKLGVQEKRLSEVSAELSKTWTIVDRMQAQHQQLHTHEKILRYELQQKRKMLQELKQELEYCREKWESARQKNTNTEIEWRSLRREFAARKALAVNDSFNNSAESGFSDGRGDDTDEEDSAVEGRIRLGPRRRARKESPRAPTPDTESEQPTDTELSESKTCSSTTLEQRTPTPETEGELGEVEITESNTEISTPINITDSYPDNIQESLDPLDQALTNVIQNLIRIDESSPQNNTSDQPSDTNPINIDKISDTSLSNTETENNSVESWNLSPDPEPLKRFFESSTKDFEENKPSSSATAREAEEFSPIIPEDSERASTNDEGEKAKTEESSLSSVSLVPTVISTSSTMPVFSIGPFPPPSIITPSFVKSVQFSDPLIVGPSNPVFAPVFGVSAALSSDESEECRKEKRISRSTERAIDSDVSVDSCSSVETVKEFSVNESGPSTSGCESERNSEEEAKGATMKMRSPEEALAARADRLKRLEEQADWLMKKMNATSRRGTALSTRLEELHEVYGEAPVPPPMPDVLPSRRLRTSLPYLPRQVPEASSSEEGIQESNVQKDEERKDDV